METALVHLGGLLIAFMIAFGFFGFIFGMIHNDKIKKLEDKVKKLEDKLGDDSK